MTTSSVWCADLNLASPWRGRGYDHITGQLLAVVTMHSEMDTTIIKNSDGPGYSVVQHRLWWWLVYSTHNGRYLAGKWIQGGPVTVGSIGPWRHFPATSASDFRMAWSWIVSLSERSGLKSLERPTTTCVGRMEAGKMVAFYCFTTPVGSFLVIFRQQKSSSAVSIKRGSLPVVRGIFWT